MGLSNIRDQLIKTNTHKASESTYIIEYDQRNLLYTDVNEDTTWRI